MTTPQPLLTPDLIAFRQTFAALRLSPIPTADSFLAHPDLRVPSIIALFLLLLASGKMLARLVITRENWDRAKAMGWFRRPEPEDDEKRLRDQEARLGQGRGGTKGVERWREQVFGRQAEEDGESVVMRDQGHLIVIFTLNIFFFTLPTLGSLVSLSPRQADWCRFLGVISFLHLAAARHVALFKLSLDLGQARGAVTRDPLDGWRARVKGADRVERWEVLAVKAFVWVSIVMTIFSSIFSLGFLVVLPPPFAATALCFRRSFVLYAVPLTVNLFLALYSLARIYLVSHFDASPWTVVVADGRMRRGVALPLWMVATFVQELGVGEAEGSRMWLPMCLGAYVLMSVMETPPFHPPPPPVPNSTPQPPSVFSRTGSNDSGGRPLSSFIDLGPTTSRNQFKMPPVPADPFRKPTVLRVGFGGDGRPGSISRPRSHRSYGDRSLGESLKDAEVQMAFRQKFGPLSRKRASVVESVAPSDIVHRAATEPSTVFHAPSVQSPVTPFDEGIRRASTPASEGGKIEWEMVLAEATTSTGTDDSIQTPSERTMIKAPPPPVKAGPGLSLPRRPHPARPRSLHDSVILDQTTQVLRQSQQVVPVPVYVQPYAIPRPLSESTQGAMTISTAPPTTNRIFGQRPAPIRTSAASISTTQVVVDRTATTTPKVDPPSRLTVIQQVNPLSPYPLSPYFTPSPVRSSQHSTASSINSLAASSTHRPLSTISTTNRTFGPSTTPAQSLSDHAHNFGGQSGHTRNDSQTTKHGRRKSDARSVRSIPPRPGPPPMGALPLPPPPPAPAKSHAEDREKEVVKENKRASSPPPFSRGLPANPRKGPPTPPKDSKPPPVSGTRAPAAAASTPVSDGGSTGGDVKKQGVCPRIMSSDFSGGSAGSVNGRGEQQRLGSGSLGSFRF